jgi:hypothetical protein
MIVNSTQDFSTVESSPEGHSLLQALYDDFTNFDDAVYPPDYNWSLQPGDPGYIAPILRPVWNTTAAAEWGFASREAVAEALSGVEGSSKE